MTTTLIELVNQVAQFCGERPQVNTTTTVGSKIRQCIADALLEIGALQDWDFLIDTISASQWVVDEAYLGGDVARIKQVYTVQDGIRHFIKFVDPMTFGLSRQYSYSSTENIGTVPRFYTMDGGYNKVRLLPYPTDDTTQQAVKFKVVKRPPDLASSDSSPIPLPSEFVLLLQKRACYLFCLRHTEDAAIAAQFNNEFEVYAQQLRSSRRMVPTSGYNIYRNGRRS